MKTIFKSSVLLILLIAFSVGLQAQQAYSLMQNSAEKIHFRLSSTALSSVEVPLNVPFTIDFETPSGFAFANNSSGNNWYVGTAAGVNNTPGGSNGLYISNNNGTTNTYTSGNTIVWAYRDVYFTPSTSDYILTFDWKCSGESEESSKYDFFNVYIGTPATPVASNGSTIIVPGNATKLGESLNDQISWQEASYILPVANYSGQTKRLYFCWKNDYSLANQPPAAIDNIAINILSCYYPSELVATAATENAVTLSWNENGSATEWEIEYGAPGFSSGTIVQASTNPFILTGLNHSTSYDVRVRAVCNVEDYSVWSSRVNFATACSTLGLPFSEDFSTFPNCWTQFSESSTEDMWEYDLTSNEAGGITGEMVATWGSEYVTSRLISPLIRFDSVALAELSFKHSYHNSYAGPEIMVQCSPDLETWTTLPFYHSDGLIPATTEVIFFNPIADSLYFAWVINGNHMYLDYWYLDDISITAPSCSRPVDITYSNVTSTSVDIEWVDMLTATSWEIEYGVHGFTQGTGTIIQISSNPTTITGLTTSTCYDFYIRAICSPGEVSNWSKKQSFCTAQIPANIPCTIDFETASGFALVNNPTGNKWYIGNAAGVNNTTGGSKGLYISNDNGVTNKYSNSETVVWAYRDIYFPPSVYGYILSFDWKCKGESEDDYFNVYIGIPALVTADTIDEIIPPAGAIVLDSKVGLQTSWQRKDYVLPVEGYSGQIKRLYFCWTNDVAVSYQPPAAIDNITIKVLSCLSPSDLVAATVTENSVTLSWNENGSATEWEVEYGTPGFSSGTIVQASTNPFILTGLNHSTLYEFRVRAVCGTDDYSLWSSRESFITFCPATGLPFSENFSTFPTCWMQTYSGGITSDMWEYYQNGAGAGGTVGEMNASYGNEVGVSRLISPLVSFNNVGAVELSFKHRLVNYVPGVSIKLQCSQDLLTWIDLPFFHSEGSIPATTQTIQFVPMADSLYFAWVIDGFQSIDWSIDDVSITATSGCFSPIGVSYSNVTPTSIDIAWVDADAGNTWEIEYGVSGFTQGTGTIIQTSSNPTTITGLTTSTCYDFYVRAVCGPGEVSNWFPKQTFCTSQIPVNVPFMIDFETTSGFGFANNVSGNNWYIGNASGVNNTAGGSNGLYISKDNGVTNTYGQPEAIVWAYRDIYFTPSISGYTLSFDWKCLGEFYSSGYVHDYFSVFMGTPAMPVVASTSSTLVPPAGVTALETQMGQQTSWQETSYTLPAEDYSGQVKRLYFCWKNDSFTQNQPPAAIDNIVIDIVSCPAPSQLVVTTITENSFTIDWNENGSATEWEIEYGAPGITSDTIVRVYTHPYTLSGLNHSTLYKFRMRAVCGVDDNSIWSSRYSVSTSCMPITIPFLKDFSTFPVCWEQSYSGGITSEIWEYDPNGTEAGGTAGEMVAMWTVGTGVSRLISPLIRFDNITAAKLSFKHYYDNDGTGVSIKLQCSPNLVTWTDLPFSHSGGDIPATTQTVQFVPMADSLYFAWVIDGNHYNIYYWYIDDVSITDVSPCLPPTNLAISNVSSTGATAIWTAGGSETSWQIEYKTVAATTWTTQVVNTPTYTLTGLQPSTAYQVRVKSLCGTSAESPYTTVVSFTTSAPPCVVPTNLAISNVSSTGATATWTAGGSETSWQIEYKTVAATSWTTQVVNTPTYTIIGLQPSTNYQVRVKSLCGSGVESGYTVIVPFTTSAPPCVVPTNLAISNISSTGATATWTAGGSENSWQIEYKTAAATTWTTQVVNTPTYTMTGLQPSTNYQVKVKSLCGTSAESPYTTVVSFTTSAPPCVVPTNLAISNVSSIGATATWTAGGSETSWQIEYKTAAAITWTTQTATTPTYNMTGLQPSTAYQLRVKSLCGSSIESAYTIVVPFTTAAPPCVVPTNLAISNISSTGATATWTAGGSETSWQIEYKTAAATSWTTQVVNTPTYTMTGLQPSTNYEVKVKSLCGTSAESPYTTVVSFTTSAPPCVVPTNLAISNVSSTGATAIWTAGGSETSWQIEYKTIAATTWTTQVVNTPTYTLTGLQPSTAYQVRVKSLCGSGVESGYTVTVYFTTAAPPCVVPTNLAISNVSSTGATATWTAGGSETSWQIEYKTAAAITWTTQTVTTPTYNMTGLQPSTAYQLRVKSLCGSGVESGYTATVSFTTAAPPCVVPTNLAISNVSSTGATATWTAGGSETSWQIEYKTAAAITWTTQVVNTPTYTIIGLQPSTNYQVRVKSLCGSGVESSYTATVSFTTAAPPCVVPTNLAISNVSSTGATATWTAGGTEIFWQIEYKTETATDWTTQFVIAPTYNITGLQPSTTYKVRVKSLCDNDAESDYTAVVSFTTLTPPCVAPTNLAISNVSTTGATATWTAGGSETSWQIEYKTTAATTWTTQVVSAPTYTMTGLQPSTAYEVKVKSLCGAGVESDYTTVVSFTTSAPPCVVPTNLAISNVSSIGAVATWTAGGTEIFWQIEYKTETATDWTTQFVIAPTYSITGLLPSTIYEVRVKSLCDNDEESGYTTIVTFTTSAPPCVAPANLAISNISSTEATVTWTAGGSETSWQVEYKTTAATTWTTQVVNTPTYTMTGLQPSTAYEVKVKSLCDDGEESGYTATVTFTTSAPPCVAPTNLAISNISSTEATATWTAGGSETFWQVEYKTTAATTWTTQVVNTPTYTMTGLQPSTAYEVKVKSLCDDGEESGYTATVTFTTSAPPCVAPTNLVISNISSTEATATWIAGGSETSWQIEYKTAAATSWPTQVVNTATYTMIGLQPSTDYEVKVKSLCDDGEESGYTEPVTFTTEDLPTYTITATAGPNGTITPSGAVIVNQGESQIFTFTPEEGYRIDVVLVDDVPQVPVPESYMFEDIQADHTIHVDFAEGVNENELSKYVALYPNPTQSLIDLKLDRDYLGATECRIYNMYGKLLRVFPVEDEITTIDVSSFATGVYFVRLTTEQGQVSKRFVKQ